MSRISEKTLIDLEFSTILNTAKEYCISDLGRKEIVTLKPFTDTYLLLNELNEVNEYAASFQNENRIPNHYFDDLKKEIKILKIENSFLEPKAFLKIANNSATVNQLLIFFKKFKDIYPVLYQTSSEIEFTKEIEENTKKIISPHGEVENNASILLKNLRIDIADVKSKISSSFNKALKHYISLNYLDDIRESIVENQRVLAVQAMHRKKIKGSLLGASKTGSIVYIAPQATQDLTRELQNLQFDEYEEVKNILKELAIKLRPFIPLLKEYQIYLTHIDIVAAKAKYAIKINAVLPKISSTKKIYLRDAYHPILYLKNNELKIETVPQTIELNKTNQIIVISGPNAGGKSITLKTIGLLQVMLQSGFLIPVHERSELSFFDTILTDIGDNQSIENHLSTYSYRLKNMQDFLKKCNENTLFLIDEFGTGSDPELGGALAEVFLEEFYSNKSFGIITTHYSNLKVLADELENVVNANMQFDERSLKPSYKLFIGQAGSSFTFEVAQKNGIPFRLINRAKKKVVSDKIRLDKTISKLQKERNKLQKTSENLEIEKSKTVESKDDLISKQQKVQEKLESFQQLYDSNQKMLTYGRKLNEIVNKYFQTNNKKELLTAFNKWILIEKSKYQKNNPLPTKPKTKKEKKVAKVILEKKEKLIKKVENEVIEEVKKVRIKKDIEAKEKAIVKSNYVYKLNDVVRLIDGNASGTIDKIEKDNVFINYGVFTTKAKTSQLELVKEAKK